MQTQTPSSTGDVQATLHFYNPPADGQPPIFIVKDAHGNGKRNYPHDPHDVKICDLRGNEAKFEIEKHGFTPLKGLEVHPIDFDDEDSVRSHYYPTVKEMVKKATGASRVVIFDHLVRSASSSYPCSPVRKVHVDQTPEAVKRRLFLHLGEEEACDALHKGYRVQLVNIWKPLNGPVLDRPLALAESDSVDDEDLVTVRHLYPDKEGETFSVRYKQGQKWWYWSNMTNREALVFLCFDSGPATTAGWENQRAHLRVAHAAFSHPGTPANAEKRVSIEDLRCAWKNWEEVGLIVGVMSLPVQNRALTKLLGVVGARLFCPLPKSKKVGWVANYGPDVPRWALETVESWNISIVRPTPPPAWTGTGLVKYTDVESPREFCFVHRPTEVDVQHLPLEKVATAKAFHFHCPPQKVKPLVEAIHVARMALSIREPAIIVWEPSPPSCTMSNRDHFVEAIAEVNVFSPNHEELGRIFGVESAEDLDRSTLEKFAENVAQIWALDPVPRTDRCIVVRAASRGCLIQSSTHLTWLPAYSKAKAIDTTGAGNAFLGSFTIGFLRSRDFITAAMYGNVGASFVIEQHGPPRLSQDATWNGVAVEDRLREYVLDQAGEPENVTHGSPG